MSAILKIRNLKKTYLIKKLFSKTIKVHALKGISFDVNEGEIFGILGPNGSGKSTTLNILSDLLTPESGNITIFDKNFLKNTQSIKQHTALINGYSSYPLKLTVFENMQIYAKIFNIKNYKKRIKELLTLVGLIDKKDCRFSQLSSGQRTRVNIVKGFLHKPKLIFMDEPTIGLDPVIGKKIRDLILKINKKEKTTIIFTSHNMQEVEEICDRIALLKEGKILKIAKLNELIRLIDVDEIYIKFKGNRKSVENIMKQSDVVEYNIKRNELFFEVKHDFNIDSLLKKFVNRKIEIKDFHKKKPTLEKVFIEISEGKI